MPLTETELRARRKMRDAARMPAIVARNAVWRSKHRAQVRAASAIQQAKIMERNRALIFAAKSKPCMDCGVTYRPFTMDFDHVRGKKFSNVSKLKYCSVERLEAEIAKCDVVCSNCHRERTYQRIYVAV